MLATLILRTTVHWNISESEKAGQKLGGDV